MNMKVLSPVGDMDSLKQAVYNGADEVYLGVKDFNARNNIAGFDLQSLKQAVDFAHVFGVRVFLTVNILFTDDEMQSALDLIVEAYNIGVDAFIVQDLGLVSLVHKYYPQIELHASTQMGIHNLEGVQALADLGFKRVVLSRETPLEEIKRIRQNSNIEIEYFVQGALCVSFSGNCYISSYLCDASGNRGKCKQLCRLPYTLKYNGKTLKEGYLLSAKDFNMLNRLQELQDAGVNSIKIEGRARRPYYVGVATRTYRRAVDEITQTKVDISDLQLAFNRGYTEGYFNGNSGIISNIQNHVGIEIGIVKKVNLGKKFNVVYISTDYDISPKSTLKFFKSGKEVATISAFDVKKENGLIKITTTSKVDVNSKVNLIADSAKEQALQKFVKKRLIKIDITAKVGEPIVAKIMLGNKNIPVFGEVCELAKNQPLSENDFVENFKKSELFDADLNLDIENVFMPKQKLNEFRRKVFETVLNELTKLERVSLNKIKLESAKNVERLKDFQFVDSKTKKFNAKHIIYDPEEYDLDDILQFKNECEKQNKIAILNLPNFALHQDVDYLKQIVENIKIAILVNNAYALNFNTQKFIGGGMNVYNSYTAEYLAKPYLKAENDQDVAMPYMTLRHCPMKEHLNANCANCPYKDGYTYTMQNGKTLKLKRKKLSTCTFYLTD